MLKKCLNCKNLIIKEYDVIIQVDGSRVFIPFCSKECFMDYSNKGLLDNLIKRIEINIRKGHKKVKEIIAS